MPRLLFKKTGNAVWISHLDLMRLFQRAFKRAGLPLTHTQGFNPRPSVSIALPLSVGTESYCELLDFDLDAESIPTEQIGALLNSCLVEGVQVLQVYDSGRKLRDLAYLQCTIRLEYDNGYSENTVSAISGLFATNSLVVEKKTKNGMQEQDIIPMIQNITVKKDGDNAILVEALICCQNPTLNPMQIPAAIERYLKEHKPDHCTCCRKELYDTQKNIFR